MTRNDLAQKFRNMHQAGAPIILYNVWDAGCAKIVAENGARAIATGSWAISAAHGYEDGESIPLGFSMEITKRIAAVTDLPLTVDFEGSYAVKPQEITANVRRVIQAGAIGVNFEDQVVGQNAIYQIQEQSRRIAAVRQAGDAEGFDLFINARTDLFLHEADTAKHSALIGPALQRAKAYAKSGADCFFVPGLCSDILIQEITEHAGLPVNVMMTGGLDDVGHVSALGVSRVSFGPKPYIDFAADFKNRLAMALV